MLSSQFAPAAVLAMGLMAAASGYCFADTLRLAFVGFAASVALMISQGLFLPAHDALPALLYGTAGGLIQAAWAGCVWLVYDRDSDNESGWDWARTKARLRDNWTLASPVARHAVRYGVALGLGVAIYRIAGMREHGYWIPLTILFVLRPERDETDRRLVLRAVGTLLGLALATGLAVALRRRRAVDRDRPQPLRGPLLRPDHGPVRALHRLDHHLRRPPQRHARRGALRRRRTAGDRHRGRDPDRLARVPDLSRPAGIAVTYWPASQ